MMLCLECLATMLLSSHFPSITHPILFFISTSTPKKQTKMEYLLSKCHHLAKRATLIAAVSGRMERGRQSVVRAMDIPPLPPKSIKLHIYTYIAIYILLLKKKFTK